MHTEATLQCTVSSTKCSEHSTHSMQCTVHTVYCQCVALSTSLVYTSGHSYAWWVLVEWVFAGGRLHSGCFSWYYCYCCWYHHFCSFYGWYHFPKMCQNHSRDSISICWSDFTQLSVFLFLSSLSNEARAQVITSSCHQSSSHLHYSLRAAIGIGYLMTN